MDVQDSPQTPTGRLEVSLYVAVITLATVIGFSVHGFYDWTGADQSYAPPILGYTALGILIALCLGWSILPFLQIPRDESLEAFANRLKISTRTLLGLTTACAFLLVLLIKFPVVISSVLFGLTLVLMIYLIWNLPPIRLRIAALLASMYCPYLWLVGYASTHAGLSAVPLMYLGLPGHLPLLFASRFLQEHPGENFWLAVTFSSVQLLVGCWLLIIGARRGIAYLLFMLASAVIGSFVLNALLRA